MTTEVEANRFEDKSLEQPKRGQEQMISKKARRAAITALAAAIATGTAATGQANAKSQFPRAHYQWCLKRYKTYDLFTNTYLATNVSAVPLAPFALGRERRCSEPLRASTHDDFRAYA